jgi:hypothetical protein
MLKVSMFAAALLASAPALADDQAQLRTLKDQVQALEARARSVLEARARFLKHLEREGNYIIERDVKKRR